MLRRVRPEARDAAVRPRHPAAARTDARRRPQDGSSSPTRLQVSLPGTPVLRYGEEIGMGDDLDQPERYSIRTPMQWSPARTPASRRCKPKQLVRPLATGDIGGYETANVDAERADETSLLAWFERMLRTLRECPEFGAASWQVLDGGDPRVLAMLYSQPTGRSWP